MGWVQVPHVGEAETSTCRNLESEAPVEIGGGPYIEAIGCMGRPRCLQCRIIIYQCFGSYWGQGCCVEILP